jgi:hypothetical protein
MRLPLCVTCKGKGLCGKPCPILEKIKYWKETIENVKDFTGTSPPSLFIGHAFYPKVFVGILSPPTQIKEAQLLDFPEKWYEQKASIEQILDYRGQLIYSRFRSNVKKPKGKLVETTQEVAMSKKAIDVEIELKSKPKFRFTFDPWVTPIGNPAPVINARLAENPLVEKKVDYLISDYDIKAEDAVVELYQHKLPISRIQKIFSAGLLGLTIQRKFVPTRWSITAVDDIVGKNLMNKVKTFQELDEIRLFSNEYIGNHYEILLIPGAYQYELIEIKHPKSVWNIFGKQPAIFSDYEPYWGRKEYAEKTGGAFYSGRLACVEYLEKIRRQAIVLIVREVLSSYWAPVGIFQMREAVRDAFNKPYEKFDSVEFAIKRICERLIVKEKWIQESKLLRILKEQKKITQFKTTVSGV